MPLTKKSKRILTVHLQVPKFTDLEIQTSKNFEQKKTGNFLCCLCSIFYNPRAKHPKKHPPSTPLEVPECGRKTLLPTLRGAHPARRFSVTIQRDTSLLGGGLCKRRAGNTLSIYIFMYINVCIQLYDLYMY